MQNILAYGDYDRSYDRSSVIVQTTVVFIIKLVAVVNYNAGYNRNRSVAYYVASVINYDA